MVCRPPTSIAVLAHTVLLLLLCGAESSQLEQHPPALKLITEITRDRLRPSAVTGFIEFTPETARSFSELRRVAEQHRLERDIIEYLLDSERASSFSSRECAYLAVRLWASTPDTLADDGRLFLRLLSQIEFTFHEKFVYLRTMVAALTPTALTQRDEQGRTPLDFALHLKFPSGQMEIPFAQFLAERTPIAIVDELRLRTLTELPAEIWSQVFHARNQAVLAGRDVDALFPDGLPERDRFQTEVLLTQLRYPDTMSDSSVDSVLRAVNIGKFLSDCRGLFRYMPSEADCRAFWRLGEHCNRVAKAGQFLQQAPHMFSLMGASVQMILSIANNIFSLDVASPNVWQLRVLRCLLEFHLEHHGDIAYLVSEWFTGNRFELIHAFTTTLNSGCGQWIRVIGSEQDLSQQGILFRSVLACKLALSRNQRIAAFLLSFTMRTALLLEPKTHFPRFLRDLNDVPDDLMRSALLTLSRYPDFRTFTVPYLKTNYPVFYRRIHTLIPHRANINEEGANSDQVGRRKMLPRQVDNVEDDYEILHRLGSGGFATVYKARCRRGSGQHEVAIKVVHSDSDDAKNEVAFMSKYCHSAELPGVTKLLDLFECEGNTYLVMELIPGTTLQNAWDQYDYANMSADDAASRLVQHAFQIFTILRRIQQLGLKHGDIQHLNNFMLDSTEDALVSLDFGFTGKFTWDRESDLSQVYIRLISLFYGIKQRLGLVWYESCPGLLGELQDALHSWREGRWSFRAILADPIFDQVRDRPVLCRDPESYRSYPDMGLQFQEIPAFNAGNTNSESSNSKAVNESPKAPSMPSGNNEASSRDGGSNAVIAVLAGASFVALCVGVYMQRRRVPELHAIEEGHRTDFV